MPGLMNEWRGRLKFHRRRVVFAAGFAAACMGRKFAAGFFEISRTRFPKPGAVMSMTAPSEQKTGSTTLPPGPRKGTFSSGITQWHQGTNMLLSETSINTDPSTIILNSSEGLGWSGVNVSVINSKPYDHELTHGGGEDLWVSMVLDPLEASCFVNKKELHQKWGLNRFSVHSPRAVFGMVRKDPGRILHVFLKKNVLNEVAGDLFDRDAADIEIASKFNVDDPGIISMLGLLQRSVSEPPAPSRLAAEYLSRALVADLLSRHLSFVRPRPVVSAERNLSARQIHRVTDYIQQHLTSEITLPELAGVAGMSRTLFIQSFKASFKETPHRYIVRTRIRQAKGLLSKSDLPLTDIALICGFFDQAHLCRTFLKATGVTPSEFRRQTQ
jgi:AraC family transcriptional regulator